MAPPNFARGCRALSRKIYAHHHAVWMQRPLDETLQPWRLEFEAHLVLDEPDRVLEFVRRLEVAGTLDRWEIRSMREWRRRGAGRFMLHPSSIAVREHGFATRMSQIRLDDTRMMRLGCRFGYRRLGIVRCRSILGRRRLTPHPEALLARACGQRVLATKPALVR